MSAVRGQRIWVVGASSGIGAALAEELHARGARVAISARRSERLAAVAEGRMVAATCDVTDPDSVAAAARTVEADLGTVDVVIVCAGTWEQFDAADWDRESFARHVEVNLLGLNAVLAEVVPPFVARGEGHIVGVASVAGYRGLPGAEAYGATKSAQITLLEAMRASLHRKGVRVTTVCPGFVRTDMTAANTFPMPFIVEPEEMARATVDGMEAGRAEVVFPRRMAVLMKLARLLPVRLWSVLVRPRRP